VQKTIVTSQQLDQAEATRGLLLVTNLFVAVHTTSVLLLSKEEHDESGSVRCRVVEGWS
jgi:hypothetical protein